MKETRKMDICLGWIKITIRVKCILGHTLKLGTVKRISERKCDHTLIPVNLAHEVC